MSLIRVGHIDLSFHDAAAREVERVLRAHGHDIERLAASHEEMFHRLRSGDMDLLVAAWLPSGHGADLAPFEQDVVKIAVLYEPCYIWGVPDYVDEGAIAGVPDLLGELARERMERLIQSIDPSAAISRLSKAVVAQYGLDGAGYHVRTGTEDDCSGRFIEAVAERRWIIVPLWHPHWLHHRYRIRALDEPKGLLGGRDAATLLVRKDAEAPIGRRALRGLARLHLGNTTVSALDDQLQRSQR